MTDQSVSGDRWIERCDRDEIGFVRRLENRARAGVLPEALSYQQKVQWRDQNF